eukprot:138238-Pyramimonas_sp.AAC.1
MSEKPTPGCHIARPGRAGQLAPPCAGIPLAHRYRRALRGTRRGSDRRRGSGSGVSRRTYWTSKSDSATIPSHGHHVPVLAVH